MEFEFPEASCTYQGFVAQYWRGGWWQLIFFLNIFQQAGAFGVAECLAGNGSGGGEGANWTDQAESEYDQG
ncbi:MAG TPA: hypothetical protein VGV35_18450 [Bryobacteraceae bacterium]|nr:hypothetical protein [Bryobacteraceae bacterium]